jgi:hypothetical protein
MKPNNSWRTRLGQILLGSAIVIALVVVRGAKAGNEPVHLTTDWSHRHLVFSSPRNLGQHIRLLSNPRYVQQLVRHNAENKGIGDEWRWHRAPKPRATTLHGDWSMGMGAGATAGPGNYPAKFSFNAGTANCANVVAPAQPDFVVYNTSQPGSGTQATIAAFDNLYSSCSTATVPFPNTYWAYNTGGRVVTSPVLSGDGSQVAFVQNSATAAPTRVQGIGCETHASSVTCILGSSVTPGDLLVWAGSAAYGGGAAAVTASDNCGGTYTVVDTGNAGGGSTNLGTAQGYSTGSHGSCTVTFTATNAPNDVTGVVEEITPGTLDVHSIKLGQSVTGGGTLTTTPVTTTATDYAFSFAVDAVGNGGSPNVASPFTVHDSDSPFGISDADFTQSGAGAVTASWTIISTTTAAAAGMMTFESTGASLVVLRWAPNSGALGSTVTPTLESPSSNYNNGSGMTCTAPCQVQISFSTANGDTATPDTLSSPFYDYVNDVLYVGDDNGYLHKFTGVFKGTPAELVSTTGNIWPANVANLGVKLLSPVFDDGVNRIFVCDRGGDFNSVDATIGSGTGGVIFSRKLTDDGFDDAPLVDSSTGKQYVFARGDEQGGGDGSPLQRVGVIQFDSSFADNGGGTEAIVSNNNILPVADFFSGDFDNAYYNSTDGTGNMYVCSTYNGLNTLWQIPIASGVMGTPAPGPTLTTANVPCSPVTEFFNPNIDITSGQDLNGTDLIFLSVADSGQTNDTIFCQSNTTGCVMSFDITNINATNPVNGSTPTSASASVAGGTSGIIVDNSSTSGGASQVYFTPLADQSCRTSRSTGGCAIQASQSGLN